MNLSDIQNSERIFALFAARSGDGKSSAAASFPKPYYQLDADMRIMGIKNSVDQGWLSPDGIEYDQYPPNNAGFDKLEKKLTELEGYTITGRFPYKTIEVASAAAITRILIIKSHGLQNGKKIGTIRVSGPADFGFEVSGTHQIFDKLRTFPCNIIVSAHVIDRWGKPKGADQYAPNEVLGSKLNLRDQLGESMLAYFDNVFQFSREVVKDELHFFVEFANDLAKNSYGLPPGKFDITKKPFYAELQRLIKEAKEGTLVKETSKGIFG